MTLMTWRPPSLCCYLTHSSSPQALLPITDFSQPLSVVLSVHPSFPLSSPLLSFPGAFCLFIPPRHESTTFFLSLCVFSYTPPFFSSSFVPSQSPHGLLSFPLRPVKPILFPSTSIPLCPLSPRIILYLFIVLSSCLSSIPTSFCSVCFTLSSFPSPFSLLSSSARAFAFDVHTFPSFNAAALMQREVCLNCLSALWIFFCTLRGGIIEHEGKLDREKEKGCSRAEISKTSLQQRETEITVDQGIKLLPYGFPMCTVRVNSFHFSLSSQSSPLFFLHITLSLSVKESVVLSHPLQETEFRKRKKKIEWRWHQQLHPSPSIIQCIFSPPFFFFQLLWDLFPSMSVSFRLFSVTDPSKLLFCLHPLLLLLSLSAVSCHVCVIEPICFACSTMEWTSKGPESLFSHLLLNELWCPGWTPNDPLGALLRKNENWFFSTFYHILCLLASLWIKSLYKNS